MRRDEHAARQALKSRWRKAVGAFRRTTECSSSARDCEKRTYTFMCDVSQAVVGAEQGSGLSQGGVRLWIPVRGGQSHTSGTVGGDRTRTSLERQLPRNLS